MKKIAFYALLLVSSLSYAEPCMDANFSRIEKTALEATHCGVKVSFHLNRPLDVWVRSKQSPKGLEITLDGAYLTRMTQTLAEGFFLQDKAGSVVLRVPSDYRLIKFIRGEKVLTLTLNNQEGCL
jgi:hypothetical protein